MSFVPKPHEIYKHFKGNLYQITAIAEHTETGETLVIYQALYGDFKTYARPLEMFISLVDKEKYPDATQEFRFALQGEDAPRQKAEMAQMLAQKQETETAAPTTPSITTDNSILEPTAEMFAQTAQEDSEEAAGEELSLDPMVLEFLDSDSYEQRLNILAGLHHRITDEMITTMAISCDIEINAGDTEERYESLKKSLLMLEKYECNRLR